jgi:ketosteroid isomerase-like protein
VKTLAFALAVVAACGGGTVATKVAPKQAPVDERKAERDAKGLVTEIHQSLGHGDIDGLMSLLAEPLVVFGPRRVDAMGARADALVALREVVDDKKGKPQLRSDELEVVASPGGHSAWAIDLLDISGKPHVVMAVLSDTDELWTVNAVAVSNTPAMREVRARLKEDAVVPTGMNGVAKLEGSARAAADKLTAGLTDQKLWGADLASRTDAVLVGPATGDITRGKKELKKLFEKRGKSNVRYAPVGDVTAAATPDGELAWASTAAVRFEDNDDPLPMRVFGVFERNKDQWTLIALQESLALDDAGVGANFKKIAPPALPAAPEPEVKKDPPKKKSVTKTAPKKKKKKKKHADDE